MRLAAAFLLVASPSLADRPKLAKDADAWCASEHVGGGDELVFGKAGTAWRADQAAQPDHPVYRVVWRGRLDPDARQDVILDEGDCGTRECLHGGYVQCRDGTYARVFSQYASRVRVKPQRTGWAVVQLEHVGDADPRGNRDRSWDTSRFGEHGYDD